MTIFITLPRHKKIWHTIISHRILNCAILTVLAVRYHVPLKHTHLHLTVCSGRRIYWIPVVFASHTNRELTYKFLEKFLHISPSIETEGRGGHIQYFNWSSVLLQSAVICMSLLYNCLHYFRHFFKHPHYESSYFSIQFLEMSLPQKYIYQKIQFNLCVCVHQVRYGEHCTFQPRGTK